VHITSAWSRGAQSANCSLSSIDSVFGNGINRLHTQIHTCIITAQNTELISLEFVTHCRLRRRILQRFYFDVLVALAHCRYNELTRSQAVAWIADRTAKNCRGHVTRATPTFRGNFCAPACHSPYEAVYQI